MKLEKCLKQNLAVKESFARVACNNQKNCWYKYFFFGKEMCNQAYKYEKKVGEKNVRKI